MTDTDTTVTEEVNTTLPDIEIPQIDAIDTELYGRISGDMADIGDILTTMASAVNAGREAGNTSERAYMKLGRAIKARAPEAGSFAKAADMVAKSVLKTTPENTPLPAALTGTVARETLLRVYDIAALGGSAKNYSWRPKTGALIVAHTGKSVAGLVQSIGHVQQKDKKAALDSAGIEYGFTAVDKIVASSTTAQAAVDALEKHREAMAACFTDAGVKAREAKTADIFAAQAVKALNTALAAVKAGEVGPDGALMEEVEDLRSVLAAIVAALPAAE